MNILVTGAGTLVGNEISLYLSRYFNITSTYKSSYPSNLKKINNIKIKKLDLNKKIFLKKKFDFVVHCASAVPHKNNISKKKLIKTNVDGFRKLLKSINKKKLKKIILLSTLSVYGKVNVKTIDEKSPINNPDPYGLSKLIMEKELIKFSKRENIKYLIFRMPGIIGFNTQYNFLSKLILSIKMGIKEVNIINPELKFNNLLHVKTLSKVIYKCITSPEISGIFVLGSKHSVKIKNLIKNINLYKKIYINYKKDVKGFNLNVKKSLKYKLPLESTKKIFLKFLDENIRFNV